MVAVYEIFGQKVGAHWLSIGTLATTFVGAWAMTGGSKKEGDKQSPPINAKSKDEEQFIQEFIKSAEAEEKKQKAKQ